MTLDPRALVPETLLAVTKQGFGLRFATGAALRGHDEGGPALREAERRRRGARRHPVQRRRCRRHGDARRSRLALQGRRDREARGTRSRRHRDQGRPNDDAVIGFIAGGKGDILHLETEKSGKDYSQKADPKQVSARGGKGHQVVKKSTLVAVPQPVTIQPLANAEGGQGVN